MTRKTELSPRKIFERTITEEDVLGACRALLELNGARVHRIVERIPWGRKTSERGIPDLLGWWPEHIGRRNGGPLDGASGSIEPPEHFFIEIKKPGGKHRPAQVAWIQAAREDGVIAFFADSVDAMVKEFKTFGIHLKGTQ